MGGELRLYLAGGTKGCLSQSVAMFMNRPGRVCGIYALCAQSSLSAHDMGQLGRDPFADEPSKSDAIAVGPYVMGIRSE
ncbi:hypothetical protein V8J82_01560 [Gymnodinialimonas sp. 2305UL16-5]